MARRTKGAPVNKGRLAALRALIAVDEGAFAEQALGENLPSGGAGRLAWFLMLGTLRHRATVDEALSAHLRQPLANLQPQVRAVLRLGAFEKLYGNSPSHAVVQQWVEAAKRSGAGRAHGLINAVLRRVQALDEPSVEARLNHPAWLIERWEARFGKEATERWLLDTQEPGPVCVVGTPRAMSEVEGTPVPDVPNARYVEDFHGVDGASWVMDPAAAMVADRFAAAVGEGRVLDACAAPGGKTLRLWSHGLDVVAADRAKRLPRLRENIERVGATIEVQARDWGRDVPQVQFDGVLIDAPCTGLGTTRKHPEIRWRRKPDDLAAVHDRQLQLLRALSPAVRKGGVLGYAVCSLEPEEGRQVIDAFLAQTPAFRLVNEWASAPPPEHWDGHQLFLLERE